MYRDWFADMQMVRTVFRRTHSSSLLAEEMCAIKS